jgi:hypothetical protein
VELGIIMAKITVVGAFAMDRGWYKVKLTDKRTGEVSNTTYRYFETWAKVNGEWKVDFVMTNKELPPRMLPEKEPAEGETAGEESPAFRRD